MAKKKSNPMSVSAGGPANINGILYQVLWTLFQSTSVIVSPNQQPSDLPPESLLLDVEPSRGGDLVVTSGHTRRVEQLKARPGGEAWSLSSVVEHVLPDLYLAAEVGETETIYRFVTEGHAGGWAEVTKFFRWLHITPCPENNLLDALDNRTEIKFRRKALKLPIDPDNPPFWSAASYTKRTLFERIAEEVRKRDVVRSEELNTTHRKLWHLLANFEFHGNQTARKLEVKIDRVIRSVVDHIDDVASTRNNMLLDLLRRSSGPPAGRKIDAAQFFQGHNLDAVPLSNLARMHQASENACESKLRVYGYKSEFDIRIGNVDSLISSFGDSSLIAFVGESGNGKSWTGYGVSARLTTSGSLTCVVVPSGSDDGTISRISDAIWSDILGHQNSTGLAAVARRFRDFFPNHPYPWITVVLDGAVDTVQRRSLARQPWEEWGIRLVLAIDPSEQLRLEQESEGRCRSIPVTPFSESELQRYLESFLGTDWTQVPLDVRGYLHTPVLAYTFRRLVKMDSAYATSLQTEYELLHEYWTRISYESDLDTRILVGLAEQYLDDPNRYPWRDSQFPDDIDSDAIQRLLRTGWLRKLPGRLSVEFEIPHVRLLNWACARAIHSRVDRGSLELTQLADLLFQLFQGSVSHQYRLGYVLMDVLWMMCRDDRHSSDIPELLSQFDSRDYSVFESLYTHLIPSLGAQAIPHLLQRLSVSVDDGYRHRQIAGAIASIKGADDAGLAILSDDDPRNRRAGLQILARNPTPRAIDQLWEFCQLVPSQLESWRLPDDRDTFYVSREIHEAFNACAKLNPEWIDKTASALVTTDESVGDLIYALASLNPEDGITIWTRHKKRLFELCPPSQRRALSTCINHFADNDETDWLVDQVSNATEVQSPNAFSALARMSAGTAIEVFDRMPSNHRYLARGWYLDFLHAMHAEEFQAKLRKMFAVANADEKLSLALLFQGKEAYILPETLGVFLLELEKGIESLLSAPESTGDNYVARLLQVIAACDTLPQIQVFQRHRETELEKKLLILLIRIGPRSGAFQDSILRDDAVVVLAKTAGTAIGEFITSFLRLSSGSVVHDTIGTAMISAGHNSINAIGQFANSSVADEDVVWDQFRAVMILMDRGHWTPVVDFIVALERDPERTMMNLVRAGVRPPNDLLKPLLDRLRANSETATPGEILAVGLSGTEAAGNLISHVANTCEPTSMRALCCITALEVNGIIPNVAIPFLTNQLTIRRHHFAAFNALAVNGSTDAIKAIDQDAGEACFGAAAVNLILRGSDQQGALDKTRQHFVTTLGGSDRYDVVDRIGRTLDRLPDDLCRRVLDSPDLENFLRTAAFAAPRPEVGLREIVIRALGHIDKDAAYLAAKFAMRSADHERFRYPSLLVKYGSEAAIDDLWDLFKVEKQERTSRALARSLSSLIHDDWVASRLGSEDREEVTLTCDLLGARQFKGPIRDIVVKLVSHPDQRISSAAAKANFRLWEHHAAYELAVEIESSSDLNQKWLCLKSLLNTAEETEVGEVWPTEFPSLRESITPFQRIYLGKANEQRRRSM